MDTQMKDKDAYLKIYAEKKDLVYRTALRYLDKNVHVAQEITQDVFMKLYNHFEMYEKDYLDAWLVELAKNEALNYIKRAKREILDENITLTMDLHGSYQNTEDEVMEILADEERREYRYRILEELYKVNERWYQAITLVYCLGKKQQDVADEMGISLEVLHSVLYRAKKWIKKEYGAERNKK